MIHFQLHGQFANQSITFCLARILAARTGLAYTAPKEFRRKDGSPVTWTNGPLFRMESAPGRRVEGTPQVIHALQWFDMDTLDPDRPIIVTQWFGQRYELLAPYRDQIKTHWLRLLRPFVDVDPDAVYVHVRRGDYCVLDNGQPPDPLRQGEATKPDEYRRCLDQFPEAKRIVLVTDAAADDSQWVMELGASLALPRRLQWEVRGGQPWDEDFLLLASARWLICSQSTFSWLAGWLGRAERICVPVFPGSFWHNGLSLIGPQMGPGGADFPNLQPTDDDRWIWLTE